MLKRTLVGQSSDVFLGHPHHHHAHQYPQHVHPHPPPHHHMQPISHPGQHHFPIDSYLDETKPILSEVKQHDKIDKDKSSLKMESSSSPIDDRILSYSSKDPIVVSSPGCAPHFSSSSSGGKPLPPHPHHEESELHNGDNASFSVNSLVKANSPPSSSRESSPNAIHLQNGGSPNVPPLNEMTAQHQHMYHRNSANWMMMDPHYQCHYPPPQTQSHDPDESGISYSRAFWYSSPLQPPNINGTEPLSDSIANFQSIRTDQSYYEDGKFATNPTQSPHA